MRNKHARTHESKVQSHTSGLRCLLAAAARSTLITALILQGFAQAQHGVQSQTQMINNLRTLTNFISQASHGCWGATLSLTPLHNSAVYGWT
jgi:hypothetical protein